MDTRTLTVDAFYGRDNGLRLDGAPYLTVCREQAMPPERVGFSTDFQPNPSSRPDGATTAEVVAEIARRWNAYPAMLAALEWLIGNLDEAGETKDEVGDDFADIAACRAAIRAARGEKE